MDINWKDYLTSNNLNLKNIFEVFFISIFFSIFVKNLIIMKISVILSIIGWCLLFVSVYLRTKHAQKLFVDSYKAEKTALTYNFISLLLFIVSILLSMVFKEFNIVI